MKTFILACVAALAAAETKEGTAVTIAQAASSDVKSSGLVQETMTDDGSLETITIAMGWETGGAKWADGAWVQNFAQWPDPSKPGSYLGVTCNAEYKRAASFSSTV